MCHFRRGDEAPDRNMATIRWTSEAETWLHDIYDYIAIDNLHAAITVIEGIYNKAQVLRQFPEIGYIHRVESEGEIRILLYGHYRIAYLLCKEKNVVDILGVFHGALPSVPIYMRHFPPDSLDSKGGKENANGKERFSHSNEGGLKHQEGP